MAEPAPTRLTVPSPETGTDYVISVVTPAGLESGQRVPAVLFMDGDDQFTPAVAAYRELRRRQAVSPLVLVGVGYGASYTKPANKRARDYTPTPHSYEPSSGGADTFLAFLRGTLWPELDRRFPVRNDVRGIAGHSLGSLLVLHALWAEPAFFTHFLASAPSIWWDDRTILRLARERHARNASVPARLFLCVGEDDTASMTSDFALLERELAERPFRHLAVERVRFPGRNHFDVLPDAFRTGLETLFKPDGRTAD